MSALIQLGLSHLQPESAAPSVDAQEWLGRFTTTDEWVKKVFEGIEKLPENFKDAGELGKILEKAAPWIKEGSKAFPPAHLLFQVVSALTKINDPRDLAILACTVAYQSVADRAIRQAGLPQGGSVKARLRDSIGVTREEFAYFTIDGVLTHPFIRRADEVLVFYAARAGYQDRQIETLIAAVHDGFREELRLLITSGESAEKYAPLRNWLGTDAKDALMRETLRRHVQYTRWLFEEAPLLDEEPYALKHIYTDTGCGVLTRQQLQEKDDDGRPARDAFKRDEENGGVHGLLETVLGYIRDPKFNDVLVIQGSAGAGKSSFTKHLAATLAVDGLTPLLVRLRDATNLGQGLFRVIGDALRHQDDLYLGRASERFEPPADLLSSGEVFGESRPYYGAEICPYVLIFDGWDEISLDVTDGYKQKVQELLAEIRREFFRDRHARTRVILTGRPSDAIDTAERFFNPVTPVLTVRQMTPDQLVEFATKLRAGLNDQPLRVSSGRSNWQMPKELKPAPLFEKYREGFNDESSATSEQILGVPFLAQLAFRVIANPGADGERVAEDSTTLLRRITEITVLHAQVPSEYIAIGGPAANIDKVTARKLYGKDLRRLLHRTAAKMTITGRESVSHLELNNYLYASDDTDLVKLAESAGGLSGLLISFFFKGGNTNLGCEFTHRALREYLFAEAVVECIKELSIHAGTTPILAIREPYWRDFVESDPRRDWSRSLAGLLAPQWLKQPEHQHTLNLLDWEARRAAATRHPEEATKPLTPAGWRYVRDGMADVYDWWAEGVPMRPQLSAVPKKNETEWVPPYFQTLIEQQFEKPRTPDILSVVPPRITTYDGHLGAALMQLTSAVHWNVGQAVLKVGQTDTLRERARVQARNGDGPIQFRPGGLEPEDLGWYFARINAAGWYRFSDNLERQIEFPAYASLAGANLVGADLRRADLSGAHLGSADLPEAYLSEAILRGADFTRAYLSEADLSEADLSEAILPSAILPRANLTGANLTDAHLLRAYLSGANLTGAYLRGADFTGAELTRANLTRANLTRANLTRANLTYAELTSADLTRADLTRADLTRADLTRADLTRADLTRADLTRADLTRADLTDADLRLATLDQGALSAKQFASLRYKPDDPLDPL